MFSIGSHQIELEDLHFVWNVPLGDIDGGTLFEVNENDFVELTDCSITIGNPTLRDEVYAFDVITDPGMLPRQRTELSKLDEFPLVRLKLNNVARAWSDDNVAHGLRRKAVVVLGERIVGDYSTHDRYGRCASKASCQCRTDRLVADPCHGSCAQRYRADASRSRWSLSACDRTHGIQ